MKLSKKFVFLGVLALSLVALPLSSAFAHGAHANVQQATTAQQVYTNPGYYQYDANYQPNYNYANNGYGWGMGQMGMGYMGMGMGCW
ncbi:hypothetical protein [Desulfotomaculum nigrificans]|uniref:hypothetical protein n=1 Tax=Desulfotomaculum nigrificans TaxID=1565 RepID=UPI0001FAE773|nr:hypothetical protein [Desulfotomaculum nigrificans]MDA8235912.1 hypothetical protein [Clostridia bacterium]